VGGTVVGEACAWTAGCGMATNKAKMQQSRRAVRKRSRQPEVRTRRESDRDPLRELMISPSIHLRHFHQVVVEGRTRPDVGQRL